MFDHLFSKVDKDWECAAGIVEATCFMLMQCNLFSPLWQGCKYEFWNHIFSVKNRRSTPRGSHTVIGYLDPELSHFCARTPAQLLQQIASENFLEAIP